jgi:subtilisin family serine protease
MSLEVAVQAHRAAGIFTVASAGNSGSGCASVDDPIAIFDEVYSVGALNSDGSIASFSSRGPVSIDGSNRPKPDIAAPGVGVLSSVPTNGYGTASGTSMAGPHVAGAVALLWSARPILKNKVAYTEEMLNRTAEHVTVTDTCNSTGWPNNVFGYGRLDVLAAVTAVPTQTTMITGVVRAAGSLQPVANAVVAATYVSPSLQFGTRTDANGVYSMTVLPGVYTMTASAEGYDDSGEQTADASANAAGNVQQDFALVGGPTATATPTFTPTPTQPIIATMTPLLTPSATPMPTNTPTLISTVTVTATLTPAPTSSLRNPLRMYLPFVQR